MICKDKDGRELDVTFYVEEGEHVEATEAYYLDDHDAEVSDDVLMYLETKYFDEAVQEFIDMAVYQAELKAEGF